MKIPKIKRLYLGGLSWLGVESNHWHITVQVIALPRTFNCPWATTTILKNYHRDFKPFGVMNSSTSLQVHFYFPPDFFFKDMKTFSNRQIFFYFFLNLNTEYLSLPISFKSFTKVKTNFYIDNIQPNLFCYWYSEYVQRFATVLFFLKTCIFLLC